MYTRRRASRKMRLVPIDSQKNIVQFNTAVPTGTVVEFAVAAAVNPGLLDDTDPAKTYYVEENAMIRGFSIAMRCYNETGVTDSNSTVMWLRKQEASAIIPPALPGPPTLATVNSMGTWANKNRVFHMEQAITGSQVSGLPMAFPSVKIPKRFHAMKRGDFWLFGIGNNTGNQLRACGTFLYKWYR